MNTLFTKKSSYIAFFVLVSMGIYGYISGKRFLEKHFVSSSTSLSANENPPERLPFADNTSLDNKKNKASRLGGASLKKENTERSSLSSTKAKKAETNLSAIPSEQLEHIVAHQNVERETAYWNIFSETDNLPEFVLSEVHCRLRLCELSFLVEDHEHDDQVTEALIRHLIKNKMGDDLKVSVVSGYNTGEAFLYIEESTDI